MPITPNYGWTTPIVNGDFGAWGSILNTAFVEVDADVKALADTVATNALNVARTNVNNTFAGTQTFNAINAAGAISTTAPIFARQVELRNPAAANDALSASGAFFAGADTTLGPMYVQVALTPSATAANRSARIAVGDDLALRDLHVLTNRTYLGQGPAGYVGSERVRIAGALHVDATVVATQFNGGGAGLTGIPQSSVTGLAASLTAKSDVGHTHAQSDIIGLVAALAGKSNVGHGHPQEEITGLVVALGAKSNVGHTHAQSDITGLAAALAAKSDVGHGHAQSDITGLVSSLAGKANTAHTHDADAIQTGQLPWARIAPAPRIDFATGTTQAFQFATAMQLAPDAIAAPTLNRPGAFTSYSWTWINVAPIGSNLATWIPVLSGVNI